MKKFFLIICGITIIILFSGCQINKLKDIGNTIEINIDNCKITSEFDSHGGFLGDGDYFAKIECNKLNNELPNNWKELPLSESLENVTNIKFCDDNGCMNMYEKYKIPNITNGYYYFLDRHSESNNSHDDTNLNNRSSWNFTLALFDKDTNIVYYYKLDT